MKEEPQAVSINISIQMTFSSMESRPTASAPTDST
jgi:hypothetical protein